MDLRMNRISLDREEEQLLGFRCQNIPVIFRKQLTHAGDIEVGHVHDWCVDRPYVIMCVCVCKFNHTAYYAAVDDVDYYLYCIMFRDKPLIKWAIKKRPERSPRFN